MLAGVEERMQLAHRNYYQTSVLEPERRDWTEERLRHGTDEPLLAAQFKKTLAHRVSSLDVLLDTCRLITPLLNALQGVVFFVKDTQARYVLANLTLAQRCGHKTVAPILGRTCADIFPDRLGPVFTRQDRDVLKSGTALEDKLELHLFHNREPGWCLTHKLPIQDLAGRTVGLAGISHDLPSGDSEHPAYAKVAAVDEYIGRHFDRQITLAELTEIAELSVSQLERYCKRVYQLTPLRMIHKNRIEHAAWLLIEDDVSITEIALCCGYSDHSAFSRQFKTLTGLTPQQFRRMYTTPGGD